MTYHISPTSGRPNKCSATVKPCPISSEHFSSREEALGAIEAEAAEEFAPAQKSMKKPSVKDRATAAQAAFDRLSPEDQADLLDMLTERREARREAALTSDAFRACFGSRVLNLTEPEACERVLKDSLESFADYYKAGCDGCSDGYSSYDCRCTRYHQTLRGVSSHTLARSMYESVSLEHVYDWARLTSEQERVTTSLDNMIARHGLDRGDIYEVHARQGYYGEEFDSISFTDGNEQRFAAFHRELLTSLNG